MQTKTEQVLSVFQQFRMAPTPIDQYEQVGKAILADKIDAFVIAGQPISFVMLGYPMKSVNDRDKVIGKLPDLAEEVSMKNFTDFNDRVKAAYAPGVKMNIVSDGFVFNDLLEAPDGTVEQYQEVVKDMGKDAPMGWFNLNDFYSGPLSTAREKLMGDHGITDQELERRILMDADVNYLYRGMMMFMNEELAIKNFPSGNQLKKASKALTRNMMLRNEAYSNLVKSEFASHIRLSMHPSINNGAKYSFQLIPGHHAFRSPWHCALYVNEAGEFITIHKKEAIEQGLHLVDRNGRPYFYES